MFLTKVEKQLLISEVISGGMGALPSWALLVMSGFQDEDDASNIMEILRKGFSVPSRVRNQAQKIHEDLNARLRPSRRREKVVA